MKGMDIKLSDSQCNPILSVFNDALRGLFFEDRCTLKTLASNDVILPIERTCYILTITLRGT